MKRSEVFDGAAREVARAWCQERSGDWDEPEGEVCAQGAIARVLLLARPRALRRPSAQARNVIWLQAGKLAHSLVPLADEGWPTERDYRCTCAECQDRIAPAEHSWGSVLGFNDAKERTQADVVALFEKGRAQAQEAGK